MERHNATAECGVLAPPDVGLGPAPAMAEAEDGCKMSNDPTMGAVDADAAVDEDEDEDEDDLRDPGKDESAPRR